ncbi:MAG: 3-deoxy-D-manno-octulosonic acid transferase [Omnitrophica bacterium]|nr:3-deoxy-D-manno-octulosonic acid transferase [Candidatus Omnitrophota bacterium]
MRLGIFPESAIAKIKGKKVIWLHAVSVGEAQAVSTLVDQLKASYPNFRLVISTVTKTGNKIARKLARAEDLIIYSPLDIGFIVRAVVRLINPQALIVAETEIWPNLVAGLAKRKIPVILVNGRLSQGSFKGYKIIRCFLKGVLQRFSLFCMQTKEDAQKIIYLGADEDKVKVTGNMKFDVQLSALSYQPSVLGLNKEERLFIAGSTHRPEERIILEVYKQLIKNYPDLRLLIAPRHIERTQEIEKLVVKFGFKPQRVSKIGETTNSVLILDTIGQLKSLYAAADIVFIGGSLVRHGGQNPIEPAIFCKPILFGPYMFNFSDVAGVFLKRKAAIMVRDAQELENVSMKLLREPLLSERIGARTREVIQENRGATLRNMELIRGLLK